MTKHLQLAGILFFCVGLCVSNTAWAGKKNIPNALEQQQTGTCTGCPSLLRATISGNHHFIQSLGIFFQYHKQRLSCPFYFLRLESDKRNNNRTSHGNIGESEISVQSCGCSIEGYGRVTGLRVVNTSGQPGTTPNIVLRGGATISGTSNNALVIVGGISFFPPLVSIKITPPLARAP